MTDISCPTPATPLLHTLNPLTLPLTGLQLIEASAGTGKTWTLAALYVRLVLGHVPPATEAGAAELGPGLYPPQILVMTFTEAATAELRERIRARLAQAARFFQTGEATLADDFLQTLSQQIGQAQWPQCAWRLDMAAQWMDDAAIFTIHGWCSRMLKTHAFDSASLFTQSRVDDSDRFRLVATQDYWRHWLYALDAQALEALQSLGDTPQALLGKLKGLWRAQERAPQPDEAPPQSPDVLLARWSLWQQQAEPLQACARLGWTDTLVQAIRDAAAARLIKGVRLDYLAGWLAKMANWAQGAAIDPEVLARFGRTTLIDKGWAAAANWTALADIEALHAHLLAEPKVADGVLAHAAWAVYAAYQRAKAQAAQFDFSDLLQNLYHALQAPDGRLAAAIRAQYPVALVDEFQDTDPWQFGSLHQIYSALRNEDGGYSLISSKSSALDTAIPAGGLIMIGDPKQAIYSFRGADLATYMRARGMAQGIYTLPGNFRSTPDMVAAVQQIFTHAKAPFGDVPFVQVAACNREVQPLQVNGQAQLAMTVWHLPFDKPPRKDVFLAAMADVFASQMVALLQRDAAQPGDMAVLVRDRHEAAAMGKALAVRGVRSVFLSERNSVYASPEASDLWRLLRAVAAPGNNRAVRAALASQTWGQSPQALDALFADESAWDAQIEQFMHWQQVWRAQGFLPMLSRLLHDQGLAARLLQRPQGERALTNLLHQGELLQAASLELQGEGALIRHLENQLRNPQASGEAAQLRLESDARLVQVVTLHKSKGLEYPLVFLPFASLYRAEESGSGRPDEERLAEDIRLFYVALTRARQAVWLGVAQVRGDVDGKTPKVKGVISRLLGRSKPGDLWDCLQGWVCKDVSVQTAPAASSAVYQPAQLTVVRQAALMPKRSLESNWWTASFSALTRHVATAYKADGLDVSEASSPDLPDERDEKLRDAQLDAAGPDGVTTAAALAALDPIADLPTDLLSTEPAYNAFPAGSRYGTLLHDLLEWQARHDWPASAPRDTATADEWAALLARQSQRLGLSAEHRAMLGPWLSAVIASNWPLALVGKAQVALQLGALKPAVIWPEMGFTLPVQDLPSQRLDALISRHVWPAQARAALHPRQLNGMLTGFMDLVLLHQGRYYVLDYKSNRLDAYGPMQLQQAMLAHRYDVQATLYVLALHRLLKSRLPDYDYDRHVGGALYLFLRCIDQPGAGWLHLAPARALIEAMDAAFGLEPVQEAAP